MKVLVRAAGIIIVLVIIGFSSWLMSFEETRSWISDHLANTIILALFLLLIVSLLIAPDRIHQRTAFRAMGIILGLVLMPTGVWGELLGGFLWIVSLGDDHGLSTIAFVICIWGGLALASAIVLIARVLLARKASRERSAYSCHA